MKKKKASLPFLVLIFAMGFSPCSAYQILLYYNNQDGTEGGLRKCAAFLKSAANQVTLVDVAGKSYDPTKDNWGPPYDQVWDARFVNRNKEDCGSGSPRAADYFDERWRSKSVSFLNHSGNLYIEAEYYQLPDRDEGIYRFLQEIGAVRKGYEDCPPSANGNSATDVEAFYPVHSGLGPVSFYGKYVGGIPLALLTGKSFVDTKEDWLDNDQVSRSIVSAWTGDQLGGAINSPLCARGKLFVVWDATMWTLWQKQFEPHEERSAPVWSENSWFSYGQETQGDDRSLENYRRAKDATRKFFPAIVRWLGGRVTPCEVSIPISTPVVVEEKPGSMATPTPAYRSSVSAQGSTTIAGPQTIVFTEPPVNIYMRFADGPGDYRLDVFNSRGEDLRTLFDQPIASQKEAWTSWDGANRNGKLAVQGTYFIVFYKDGIALRKIILKWVSSPRP